MIERRRLRPGAAGRRSRLRRRAAAVAADRVGGPVLRGRSPGGHRRAAPPQRGAGDRGRRQRRGQGVPDRHADHQDRRASAAAGPAGPARRACGTSSSSRRRTGCCGPSGRAPAATRSSCSPACWPRSAPTARGSSIAEQIPAKLVPDVVKNTALKVLHRLPAARRPPGRRRCDEPRRRAIPAGGLAARPERPPSSPTGWTGRCGSGYRSAATGSTCCPEHRAADLTELAGGAGGGPAGLAGPAGLPASRSRSWAGARRPAVLPAPPAARARCSSCRAADLLADAAEDAWLRVWTETLVLAFLTNRPLPAVPRAAAVALVRSRSAAARVHARDRDRAGAAQPCPHSPGLVRTRAARRGDGRHRPAAACWRIGSRQAGRGRLGHPSAAMAA